MTAICIDGFNLAMAQGTGIATYGRNLLATLRECSISPQILYGPPTRLSADNALNEVLLADQVNVQPSVNKRTRFLQTFKSRYGRSVTRIDPSDEVIWQSKSGGKPDVDTFWAAQNLFYYAHRSFQAYGKTTPVLFPNEKARPDVMHWTATLPLTAKGVANVYTIHDIIPLKLPFSTTEDKTRYRKLCEFIATTADHIAVVSETTRQDVIRILGVEEARVTNTYQSVSIPEALAGREQSSVERELSGIFNLGWKDYYLFFGAIEPKKNLGRLVEAYLSSGSKRPLVIVGGRAWLEAGEIALLNQVQKDGGPNAERIRRYDYMPFSMLVSLIRGARATMFPSLYEGFGLPVLESMLLGTATLASTSGSLPEVTGGASWLADANDAQSIARGIQAFDADEDLLEDLVEKGRVRARYFSQDAHRDRLQALYAKIGIR